MVRFEKLKIWHAQGSSADLSDVARDVMREMTSRTRGRFKWQQSLSDVPGCYGVLLWTYIINRKLDFAHFQQEDWYGQEGLTYQ